MKILRLKLVNYIGIFNGTGLNEIELNFNNSDSNTITGLFGSNGSGKSTIISQLQPFKESFDSRKQIILSGMDGLKEIDIQDGNNLYEIKHTYLCKQNKTISNIKKNGEELNKSGLDKSFVAIIEEELGLTKDYFTIGKIGSNTENFIELSPSERKKYIGTFVQDINKFLDKYDIVKEKANLEKKRVNSAAEKLKNFTDTEVLKREISLMKDNNLKVQKEIETLIGSISEQKTNQNNIRNKIINININNLNTDLINKKNYLNQLNSALLDNDKNSEELNKLIKSLTDNINKNNINIATNNERLKNINIDIVNKNNKLVEFKTKTESVDVNDISKTKEEISKLTSTEEMLKNNLTNNEYYKYLSNTDKNISNEIMTFMNLFDVLYENYQILKNSTITDKSNISLLFSSEYKNTVNSRNLELKNKIETLKNSLNTKTTDKNVKESKLSSLDILKQRPNECNIDTCPFIQAALKLKNLPDEISILAEEISKLDIESNNVGLEYEEFNNIISIYRLIIDKFRIMDKNNITYLLFVEKYGNIVQAFNMNRDDFKNAYDNIIEIANSAVSDLNNYNITKNNLSQLKYKLELIESQAKNSEYFKNEIDKLNTELSKLKENRDNLEKELNQLNSDNMLYNTSLNSFNNTLLAINNIDLVKAEINKLEAEISEYSTNKILYDNITGEITKNENALTMKKLEKSDIDSQLKTKEFNLQSALQLQNELTSYQKALDILNVVKDTLDPKSGIPLVFIQSYLTSVERIASNLLSIAYNDEYSIKFNVTEKDFFIMVKHGDIIAEDIKICSQGEIALITISISLALIQQSMGSCRYNILYLDEIDGPLDSSNRQAFINIINAQIQELNCEQVFVISHNDAYNYVPMNLILLKNHDFKSNFMQNKTVLFDLGQDGTVGD